MMHDLIQFYEWHGEEPRGWIEADLEGVGVQGRAELRAFVIQLRVMENHQNGKDTHMRGVQIFVKDDRPPQAKKQSKGKAPEVVGEENPGVQDGWQGLTEPDWMGEPQLR